MAREGQTQTKAERRQARVRRQRADGIDSRLARIEDAVATESNRSEELLDRLRLAKDALQTVDSGLSLEGRDGRGLGARAAPASRERCAGA